MERRSGNGEEGLEGAVELELAQRWCKLEMARAQEELESLSSKKAKRTNDEWEGLWVQDISEVAAVYGVTFEAAWETAVKVVALERASWLQWGLSGEKKKWSREESDQALRRAKEVLRKCEKKHKQGEGGGD